MSWRTGSKLFLDIWPAVQRNIADAEERVEFTAELLKLFANGDMDLWDVEDVHSDIRAAIRLAGFDVSEPERYTGDP